MIKKFVVTLVVLFALSISGSRLYAWNREQKVLEVTKGMTLIEVTRLLGKPRPDVPSARAEFRHCGRPRTHYWFTANPAYPGLWYGRLEDNLLVAFVDGKVCDFVRVGL